MLGIEQGLLVLLVGGAHSRGRDANASPRSYAICMRGQVSSEGGGER